TSFLTTDYVPYESSGTKLWGTEGELGLMKKPFTAMAWVKFAGQGNYGNAILTISNRENGRSGTGIGFMQGYGSFAYFGNSMCRGCSHALMERYVGTSGICCQPSYWQSTHVPGAFCQLCLLWVTCDV
ncbi:unnamed protein product, partial [Symbiodinium sp. KB8]